MIYYHVDRANKLTEGLKLSLFDFEPSNSLSRDYFANKVSEAGYLYLQDVCMEDNIIALQHRFRELEFEYVRRLHYPDKSSRFQSFFCAESFEYAKKWMNWLSYTDFTPRIFTVSSEVTGSLHDVTHRDRICNGNNEQPVFSVYEEYQFAHKYWNGFQSDNPKREIVLPLLDNVVTVIERVY